jgi:hypothetical protein
MDIVLKRLFDTLDGILIGRAYHCIATGGHRGR